MVQRLRGELSPSLEWRPRRLAVQSANAALTQVAHETAGALPTREVPAEEDAEAAAEDGAGGQPDAGVLVRVRVLDEQLRVERP